MQSWRPWFKPMVLMRARVSDAFPLALPGAVFVSGFLSMPEIADPSTFTPIWCAGRTRQAGRASRSDHLWLV